MQHFSHLNQGEKLLKLGFLSQKLKYPKFNCFTSIPKVYRLRELFDSSQAVKSVWV